MRSRVARLKIAIEHDGRNVGGHSQMVTVRQLLDGPLSFSGHFGSPPNRRATLPSVDFAPNADVRVFICLDRCHISSSGCGFLPMEQRIFEICQPSCASVHAGSDFIPSTWQADMPMNGCSVGTVTWHD
jgi:hypothetical protein